MSYAVAFAYSSDPDQEALQNVRLDLGTNFLTLKDFQNSFFEKDNFEKMADDKKICTISQHAQCKICCLKLISQYNTGERSWMWY